jgi:hypothetical protein
MHLKILERQVEGDEHGLYHLESMGQEAEALFDEAKLKHRSVFHDSSGSRYVLTRESAGHYLVANSDA